jgi:hypothetical protein
MKSPAEQPPIDPAPADPNSFTSNPALIATGWAAVLFFTIAALVFDRRTQLAWFQVAWGVGFAGYGLVLLGVWRTDEARIPGRWRTWLAGFVLLRILLLPTVPSDDLHRYMWEGKIQRYGYNPYVLGPDDPRLKALAVDDRNHARINHPDYPAIYPPAAQLFFREVSKLGDSVYLVKGALVAVEIVALALLGRVLAACGIARHRSAVYGLSPLALSAIAIEGHVDALMLCGLVAAAGFVARERMVACGIALGLAIAAKLVCVVLLPWLMVRRPLAAGIAGAVVAVSYLPFADAGGAVFQSLTRFGGTRGALGVGIGLAESLTTPARARGWVAALLIGFLLLRLKRREPFAVYATRGLAAGALALPVVHFWYLTWMLIFAWARLRVSWLVLTATMGCYFAAEAAQHATGTWRLPDWAPIAIYGPFAVTWLAESLCDWRKRKPATP